MNIPKTKEDFIAQVSNLDQAWDLLNARTIEYKELEIEKERLIAQVKSLNTKKQKRIL